MRHMACEPRLDYGGGGGGGTATPLDHSLDHLINHSRHGHEYNKLVVAMHVSMPMHRHVGRIGFAGENCSAGWC